MQPYSSKKKSLEKLSVEGVSVVRPPVNLALPAGRTVHNNYHRFLKDGPEGLKDRRKGSCRKITSAEEAANVASKRERPLRSACFIRNRLKLRVIEETVRPILVKHHLNGKAPEPNKK